MAAKTAEKENIKSGIENIFKGIENQLLQLKRELKQEWMDGWRELLKPLKSQ